MKGTRTYLTLFRPDEDQLGQSDTVTEHQSIGSIGVLELGLDVTENGREGSKGMLS